MAEKKKMIESAAPAADKKKALETAMAQIEKAYGKGSIMRLGDNTRVVVEAIPTGSLALDLALGIGQSEKVAGLLVQAGYENIRITRDTGRIDRVVEGQRPKEREIPDLLHESLHEEEG